MNMRDSYVFYFNNKYFILICYTKKNLFDEMRLNI